MPISWEQLPKPRQCNFGSYGAGTSAHIQGALLNMQAGLDLVHVPFAGAASLVTNLVGGQVDSAFIDSASARRISSRCARWQ